MRFSVAALQLNIIEHVEKSLPLPRYRAFYDQQETNACVGFACSWMMSILNRRCYDAVWLWQRAKEVDEWDDTNPGDNEGTSIRAAMDVLRNVGHCRVRNGRKFHPRIDDGILQNRWATRVDEIRTCIANGIPVVLGIPWYDSFFRPERKGRQHWIGLGNLGKLSNYHAICAYRASDRYQAIGLMNSWGADYPPVLLSYALLERMLDDTAEATVVTDRD